ncbi:MAG: DUF3307 domain-containing protein [Gemmobacter sp.]
MPETLAALLLAHVLADFVFQTNWMVANKKAVLPLAAHIGVVLATAVLAAGTLHPVLFALALAHLGIDLVKTHSGTKGLSPFLLDQAAHLVTLVAVAAVEPDLWAQGLWSAQPWLPGTMALVAGFILATRAGGFAMGMLMVPWGDVGLGGLPGGGRIIGLLERGLIFVLVLTGQAGGIGLLIAAKSVLRFGAVKEEGRLSEYVIIGTLASFGWAIVAATATVALMAALPPLGIPDLSP